MKTLGSGKTLRSTVRSAMLSLGLCAGCVAMQGQVRVASDDALKAATKRTAPDYPAMAKQMHIGGKVAVEVTIDTEGNVESARIVSGNALLTPNVLTAVKKWSFAPFIGPGGEASKAIAVIEIDFKP